MGIPDEHLVEIDPQADLATKNLVGRLSLINVYLNKGLAWVAGGCLLLMVLVVVANAVSRVVYVPFTGTIEVVGWLGALAIAFGLGFTQLQDGYVEIDALVKRFPQKLQKAIKTVILLLSSGFFILVAWQLCLYALKIADNGNLSETMGIAFYPLIFLVALGFAGLSFALLVDLLRQLSGGDSK